jgi:hypothetical protein
VQLANDRAEQTLLFELGVVPVEGQQVIEVNRRLGPLALST